MASASGIRGHILDSAGIDHRRDPAAIDESKIKARMLAEGAPPEAIAMALAEAKATVVAGRHPGALVIGADQILECDGRLFDKPTDVTAAAETLRALRGRAHRLLSAEAVATDGRILWRHAAEARLIMRDFSDEFLEHYLEAGGPGILESVGAYRLEKSGAQLFETIEGDYFTILGLPLLPLLAFLRRAGALAD